MGSTVATSLEGQRATYLFELRSANFSFIFNDLNVARENAGRDPAGNDNNRSGSGFCPLHSLLPDFPLAAPRVEGALARDDPGGRLEVGVEARPMGERRRPGGQLGPEEGAEARAEPSGRSAVPEIEHPRPEIALDH